VLLSVSARPAAAAIVADPGRPDPAGPAPGKSELGNSEPGKRPGARKGLAPLFGKLDEMDVAGLAGLLGNPGLGKLPGTPWSPDPRDSVAELRPPKGVRLETTSSPAAGFAAPPPRTPAGAGGGRELGVAARRSTGPVAGPGCEPPVAAADRLRSRPPDPGLIGRPDPTGAPIVSGELPGPVERMLGGRPARAVELVSVSAGLVWLATRAGGRLAPAVNPEP